MVREFGLCDTDSLIFVGTCFMNSIWSIFIRSSMSSLEESIITNCWVQVSLFLSPLQLEKCVLKNEKDKNMTFNRIVKNSVSHVSQNS